MADHSGDGAVSGAATPPQQRWRCTACTALERLRVCSDDALLAAAGQQVRAQCNDYLGIMGAKLLWITKGATIAEWLTQNLTLTR